MTDKTFTVAGTSNFNGVIKYRVANDLESRVKHLERVGHTDVNMMWLPEPMTRDAAISWLNSQGSTCAADLVEEQVEVSGPALQISESAIQQRIAEICEYGRPRNARGYFIKYDVLRQNVIQQLGAV